MLLHHNGKVIKFKECADGLYYWDSSPTTTTKSKTSVTPYSFINTVANNKSRFTQRDVKGAEKAREVQSIIAWPGDKQYQKIIQQNQLMNSSITIDDVIRATEIHGPALPLVQSRTTRQKPEKVRVQKLPLPLPFLKSYPNIQLYVDFFFVNRLPFLHTKSSKIDFLTVQSGETRHTKSIVKGIKRVINTYENRGFSITDLHADNEFDINILKQEIDLISTHFYGRIEHVGTIERSIRTVKERTRAICHSLPYRRYTKLMVNSMVKNVIFWMNSFPSRTGASQDLSPAAIVLGRGRPDFSKKHIAFGSFAMVYDGTTNNMKSRTTPAIPLKPSNQHGGSFFMSLLSRQKLHAYQWEEIPISKEVIDRVHELAKQENQPLLPRGELIFEWDLGMPIQDNIEFIDESNIGENTVVNNVPISKENSANESEVSENESPSSEDGNEITSSEDGDISYDSDSDKDEHHVIDDDEKQHSIDGFFEEDLISEGTSDFLGEETNIDGDVRSVSLHDEALDDIPDPMSPRESLTDTLTGEPSVADETTNLDEIVQEDNDNVRRSNRSNKGVISRIAMDHRGKD